MRRRRYLAVAGSLSTVGCLGSDVPPRSRFNRGVASFAERGHPYTNQVLTVTLDQAVEARGDVNAAIEAATAFWQRYAPRYADFPVSYSVEPDAESPDVEVRTVDTLDHCGEHASATIAGCAPRVTEETVRPETATIRVEADLREPFLTRILKHEFGHTLGLDHEQEPRHIMSTDPADWVPQYDRRRTVADHYVDAVQHHNTAVERYNTGTREFEDEAHETAVARYEKSVAAVEASRTSLARARSTAREIGEETVVDRCRESARTIERLGTSAEHLGRAATAYSDGNMIDGNRYQRKHADAYEAFREGTFHPASDVLELLGVPAVA